MWHILNMCLSLFLLLWLHILAKTISGRKGYFGPYFQVTVLVGKLKTTRFWSSQYQCRHSQSTEQWMHATDQLVPFLHLYSSWSWLENGDTHMGGLSNSLIKTVPHSCAWMFVSWMVLELMELANEIIKINMNLVHVQRCLRPGDCTLGIPICGPVNPETAKAPVLVLPPHTERGEP